MLIYIEGPLERLSKDRIDIIIVVDEHGKEIASIWEVDYTYDIVKQLNLKTNVAHRKFSSKLENKSCNNRQRPPYTIFISCHRPADYETPQTLYKHS